MVALVAEGLIFDAVISLNFLHLFRYVNQKKLVSEMVRVCRPGGVMVMEFENIHKGLFITRYREQREKGDRNKFNSAKEIREMFSGPEFVDIEIRGIVLPLAYRVLRHWPTVGRVVERITWLPIIKWMAARILVSSIRQ